MSRLSIVIVNYRSTQPLKSCLASLSGTNANLDLEVVVVNNDSHQELASVSNLRGSGIHLIQNRLTQFAMQPASASN
jgi:GT2 family glycosyltransferase